MASSPFAASSGLASPEHNIRERNSFNFNTPSREPLRSASPGSTLSGSPGPAPNVTAQSLSREVSISSLRGIFTPSGTPSRKPIVRADPSMLTCFDPADKELYDLWVPKK